MKNNVIKLCIIPLVTPLLFGVAGNANAAIYKCVNPNAKVYYNDKPCPNTDVETQLKSVKDPVDGYIPPAFVEDKKVQRSKGVVVGDQADSNNEDSTADNNAEDESLSNEGTSASNNANTDSAADTVVSQSSGVKKRKKPKAITKAPLPAIPLKTEKITREPRAKLKFD